MLLYSQKGSDELKNRIKELRKEIGLNQTEFGERIGVKQTTIAGYETGAKNPLDSVVRSICREFKVNEEWLRNGTGEMFVSRTRRQVITDFMGDLIMDEEESFRCRLVEALAQLNPEEWEVLRKIAESATKKG
jgi:DNA-binding XRE family transcriptional regulator